MVVIGYGVYAIEGKGVAECEETCCCLVFDVAEVVFPVAEVALGVAAARAPLE